MDTARTTLQTNFRAMQENQGLRDMKFSLGKVSESTVEDVCVVVNRVLDEVDGGRAKTVAEWGDSNRP